MPRSSRVSSEAVPPTEASERPSWAAVSWSIRISSAPVKSSIRRGPVQDQAVGATLDEERLPAAQDDFGLQCLAGAGAPVVEKLLDPQMRWPKPRRRRRTRSTGCRHLR